MSSQSPLPDPPRSISHSMYYYIGLGIGVIPLVVFLLGFTSRGGNGQIYLGINGLATVGLLLYPLLVIASIVCLLIQRIRFVGYGLLTMVAVSPVVAYISCVVLLTPH